MTREKILAGLRKCSKKLGRTPTYTEIWRFTKITKYVIKMHFGTLAQAYDKAGIVLRGIGHRVDTVALLKDWAHLTRKLGRPPSFMEYRKAGQFGANSILNRCGAWSRVGERFRAVSGGDQGAQAGERVGRRAGDHRAVGRKDDGGGPAQDGEPTLE